MNAKPPLHRFAFVVPLMVALVAIAIGVAIFSSRMIQSKSTRMENAVRWLEQQQGVSISPRYVQCTLATIDDALVQCIAQLDITSVTFTDCKIDSLALASLGEMHTLDSIVIDGGDVDVATVVDSLASTVEWLPGLTLIDVPIPHGALEGVANIEGLQFLAISHCNLERGALSSLVDCEYLRAVTLREVSVSTQHVADLARCDKLEYLSLYGTNLDDQGVELFRGCSSLREVEVSKTLITNVALGWFGEMGLERVLATDTAITSEFGEILLENGCVIVCDCPDLIE